MFPLLSKYQLEEHCQQLLEDRQGQLVGEWNQRDKQLLDLHTSNLLDSGSSTNPSNPILNLKGFFSKQDQHAQDDGQYSII